MKKLLAFDLSKTCTGWAYFEDGVLKEYDTIKIKYVSSDPHHMGEFLFELFRITGKLMNRLQADFICAEESVGGQNSVTIHNLGQIFGILHMNAYFFGKRKLPVIMERPNVMRKVYDLNRSKKAFMESKEYHPDKHKKKSQLDKAAGNFQKQAIIDYINPLYNKDFELKDNDIVDAIFVGHYFMYADWKKIKAEQAAAKKKKKKKKK